MWVELKYFHFWLERQGSVDPWRRGVAKHVFPRDGELDVRPFGPLWDDVQPLVHDGNHTEGVATVVPLGGEG